MLQIRAEQYEILAEEARRYFHRRALQHFKREWNEEVSGLDDDDILEMIEDAHDKCDQYGIEAEPDVITFAEICLLLGDDFEEDERYPWAREILNEDKLDGVRKVLLLQKRMNVLLDEMSEAGD